MNVFGKDTNIKIDNILQHCDKDNYCLYKLDQQPEIDQKQTKQLIREVAKKCGLLKLDTNICADNDSLTSICQKVNQGQHEYIPYSNKKLSWHTDGYYNLPENTINSMLLHCFNAANLGGESAFMDHEIAYILIRDENPNWINALSKRNAMTIPANILDGKIIRPEQTGPVFSFTPQGRLHMRYTARQRNIVWSEDQDTLDAVEFLQKLLGDPFTKSLNNYVDSKYIIKHKFKAGEGIISRNVLHCRSAFNDLHDEKNAACDSQRLLFRGRFYDELSTRHV